MQHALSDVLSVVECKTALVHPDAWAQATSHLLLLPELLLRAPVLLAQLLALCAAWLVATGCVLLCLCISPVLGAVFA